MTIKDSNSLKNRGISTQYHKINAAKYQDVWDFQSLLHNNIKSRKASHSLLSETLKPFTLNHLIFCEHKPVFTLGKSAKHDHLLESHERLEQDGFEVYSINRGGDITYHGPGQLTGYLIMDLELLYRDVHKYVRNIEKAIILLLKEYGLVGQRIADYTGVWVQRKEKFEKVCAIGVHFSRWVSMHGFALNINPDLKHFDKILPCGISDSDKSVSSLSALLERDLDFQEVESKLLKILSEVFELKIVNK